MSTETASTEPKTFLLEKMQGIISELFADIDIPVKTPQISCQSIKKFFKSELFEKVIRYRNNYESDQDFWGKRDCKIIVDEVITHALSDISQMASFYPEIPDRWRKFTEEMSEQEIKKAGKIAFFLCDRYRSSIVQAKLQVLLKNF